MSDRNISRPPSGGGLGGMSKTLALWALFIVIFIAGFQYLAKQKSPTEVAYTEFAHQLDAGNVASVEIVEGKQVRGEFRTAIPVADNKTVKQFTVLLPIANSEAELARMKAAGVAISGKEPKENLVGLLIAAL